MKNAGMAGAVALVGIGLITIGLSNFASRAEAVPSVAASAGQGQAHEPPSALAGSDCVITLPPSDWFSAIGYPGCFATSNDFMGDWNGDGLSDSCEMIQYALPGAGWSNNTSTPKAPWLSDYPSDICWSAFDGEALTMFQQDGFNGMLDWHLAQCQAEGYEGHIQVFVKGLADVDGDGRRDLVVRRQFPGVNETYVHLNITAGDPLVADINRDGFVNAQDLGLLIAAWTG